MSTEKKRVKANTTQELFARFMKDVPRAKGILVEIMSRNPDGLSRTELLTLARKRMPLKRKMLDLFGFSMFTGIPLAITLEDLTKEGRVRGEAEILYPR